jgi:heme exporter protein C
MFFNYLGNDLPPELKGGNTPVIKLGWDQNRESLFYISTVAENASFVYPYVPNLDERIRILNLHVPQAWIAVIAYLLSMIYGIRYLRTNNLDYDMKTTAAASLGTLFAILATTTGMVWAKFNWGSFWSWDPRQTSIFVLILIYVAYFALRSSIENPEKRARLSSVYSIIAFITVPFLVFILPRLSGGLHPGSADDNNAGPVVSSQPGALDSNLMFTFGLSLFAFTIIFFWMFNIVVRTKILNNKLEMAD